MAGRRAAYRLAFLALLPLLGHPLHHTPRPRVSLAAFSSSSPASSSASAPAAHLQVEHRRRRHLVAPLFAAVEDELDTIDDVTMNRPANVGRDKVKMWGVWLDSDVAGRKVLKRRLADVEGDEDITDGDKAEVFFDEGLLLFQGGDYVPAAALMGEAVELVGKKTRRGGEFRLWCAQALHASGEIKEANAMLRDMKGHSDSAVKRVSQEILYIFEAPRLELDPNDLMQFDLESLSGLEGFGQKKSLAMASATSKGGGYAVIEPGPDKYSLEWVQEQRIEGPAPIDYTQLSFAAGLTALSLLYFAN